MNKRRFAVIVATAVLLLTFLSVVALYYRVKTEMVRNYHHIALGMTLDEVVAVIGRHPVDLTDTATQMAILQLARSFRGPNIVYEDGVLSHMLPQGGIYKNWLYRDNHMITVAFDATGKVVRKELVVDDMPPPPTLFERAKKWLGL